MSSMHEIIHLIDKVIEGLAYQIIGCAALFSVIWLIVWLQDLRKWHQRGYAYRWWYVPFDFATPTYLLLLLILKLFFDISLNPITIAHHLALTCSLQIGLGLSRRLDMEEKM